MITNYELLFSNNVKSKSLIIQCDSLVESIFISMKNSYKIFFFNDDGYTEIRDTY